MSVPRHGLLGGWYHWCPPGQSPSGQSPSGQSPSGLGYLSLKISKFILGVNKKSCNFAILSELGRFPIYISLMSEFTFS
jgi:hypothetical protein